MTQTTVPPAEPSTEFSAGPIAEYRTTRRVEFSDTDTAGMMHFSRFFIYMESVEHEFLRHLGTSVAFTHEGEEAGWPRLMAHCEYRSPARFEDVLDIRLRVQRKGQRSMTYEFEFKIGDRLVAEGRLAAACCRFGGPKGLESMAIPEDLAARIAEAKGGA
jgi:4-hydroxybenzoyl-CoA thioesterase/acyl-CoA thioester hydrolase